MSKPVFMFPPASWCPKWAFEPLRAELHALGFATWSENVPTQQGDPSKTAEDDVAFIRAAVESYVARGQDVVMCGWSMAAWSGPAATEGLLRSPGQSTSKGKGAVVGLVYMACVIPERQGMNAEEIMGRWGGAGGAWYDPKDLVECGMEYGPLIGIKNPRPVFFQGLPPHVDQDALAKTFVAVSAAAFGTYAYVPRDSTGKFLVPAMYVSTRLDASVPVRVQDQVITAEGNRFKTVFHVQAGHMVGMIHPKEVAAALVEFAEGLGGA